MYADSDTRAAEAAVKACRLRLFAALGVFLALYVAMAIIGTQGGMLAALLAALVFVVFYGDLYLMPAVRYKRFLNQLHEGLRREIEGTILELSVEEQTQDGARVRALRVRLADDSDERLFWVNASKAEYVPEAGARVRIESSGRHVTAIERIAA